MNDLTTSFSRIRHRIGMMEMGLKSAQLVGGVTFGMGWIIDIFHESGMKGTDRDQLKRFAILNFFKILNREKFKNMMIAVKCEQNTRFELENS